MRAMFTAFWAALVMVFEGITEFAAAFKGAGEITNGAVSQFAEEERLRSEATLKELSKQLASAKRSSKTVK